MDNDNSGDNSAKSHKGYDFEDITGQVIGLAIRVHKELGAGFLEVAYQRALAHELEAAGVQFAREQNIPVFYRGLEIDLRRVDFVIGDCIVEIKARSELLAQDYVQALSYLRASGYRLGLLINFGAEKVQVKRFVNDKAKYRPEEAKIIK